MSLIRAAIYCRVSTSKQAEADKVSIPAQVAKCRNLVKESGWQLVETYIDPGYSSNTLNRPALQRLLKELDDFDVLVVYDPDRISRDNALVEATIYNELDTHLVQVTSVTQPVQVVPPRDYDPRENDTIFIQRRISGLAGGLDNRRRRRRLREGMIARLKRGLFAKPRAYGYEVEWKQHKENGKLRIEKGTAVNEQEAAVVRRIFREYVTGRSSLAIARDLNRDKIPSKRNSLWHCSTVRAIIRNPVYYGKVRRRYMATERGKRKRVPSKQWELIEGKHPPIITEELHRKAQLVRERKENRFRAKGSKKLLSGLVRCGFCGWAMWTEGVGKKDSYVCGNYRSTGACVRNAYKRFKLETEVIQDVHDMLNDPSIIEKVRRKKRTEEVDAVEKELDRVEKQLAQFPMRKSRLFELYETEVITKGEFIERRDKLEEEEGQMKCESKKMRALQGRITAREITAKMVHKVLANFLRIPDAPGTIEERKQNLSNLIESIELKIKQYKLNLRFVRSPSS